MDDKQAPNRWEYSFSSLFGIKKYQIPVIPVFGYCDPNTRVFLENHTNKTYS